MSYNSIGGGLAGRRLPSPSVVVFVKIVEVVVLVVGVVLVVVVIVVVVLVVGVVLVVVVVVVVVVVAGVVVVVVVAVVVVAVAGVVVVVVVVIDCLINFLIISSLPGAGELLRRPAAAAAGERGGDTGGPRQARGAIVTHDIYYTLLNM